MMSFYFLYGLVLICMLIFASRITGIVLVKKIVSKEDERKMHDRIVHSGCITCCYMEKNGTIRVDGPFIRLTPSFIIGYIYESGGRNMTICVVTRKDNTHRIFHHTDPETESKNEEEKTNHITIYEKAITEYSFTYYHERRCERLNWIMQNTRASSKQKELAQEIVNTYVYTNRKDNAEKPFATAFIYGKSGSGKSTLGILVAKALNAPLVLGFDPTVPGDSLGLIISDKQRENQTLVILVDEFDKMIERAYKGIPQNPSVCTRVYDKGSLNQFLDWICSYDNILVIFTSNTPPHQILKRTKKKDISFTRNGRMDLVKEL